MIKKQTKWFRGSSNYAPIVALILIFAIWEGSIRIFNVPQSVLPSLFLILKTLITKFTTVFGIHLWYTFRTVLIGMLVGVPIGIIIGSIVSQISWVGRITYPYIIALVTIPMVAILPILMFWVGFGMPARVIVVICQVVPIVTLQSLTGFNTIERNKVNLGLSVGASTFTRFIKIVFPNALPYVFTGMRLGSIFATTATISAELVSSSEGLGNRVTYFSKIVATDYTFSCIFLIAAIGVTVYTIISVLEKKITVWKS